MRRRTEGLIAIAMILLVPLVGTAPPTPAGPVVLNEIAWAGAAWDPTAEWIELFNLTPEPIDLSGWRIVSSDGSPEIALHGTIPPHVAGDPTAGFFLLERGTDESVPTHDADQIYHGALTDRGETLYLYDPAENLVDSANSTSTDSSPWPAGTDGRGSPPYASMERIDYRLQDLPENWTASSGESVGSNDPTVRGTPARENAAFNLPPTPSFEITPRYPTPGKPIVFDASASSDANDRIASYRWSFGDGTESEGPTPSHAYAVSGDYAVALTLTDEKGGRSTLERLVRVQVTSPPLADFSIVVLTPVEIPRAGGPLRFQDESSDADGPIVAWMWDFGDGTTSADPRVLHTFDRGGEYVISLRVADDQGEEALQTRSLRIASRVPTAVFEHSVERPNAGEPTRFDASPSADPDGSIAAYRWDFDGDGVIDRESDTPIVEHAFASGGEFDVILSVIDDSGETSPPYSESIDVNTPPIAEFQLSAFEVDELEPIRFTDRSYDEDGSIVERRWGFGDGTGSPEVSPEHVYENDGAYAASLTVTDDNGARHTTFAEVTIVNLPPTARLSTDTVSRPTGERFRLDASESVDPSPSGSIARYEWDLDGDGTFEEMTTAPTLSHAYPDNGTHTVRVRVTDDDGAVAVSDPLALTVTNRPPRVERIEWTPESPTDAEEVGFTAKVSDPDGEVERWIWDLGDAGTAIGATPTARFPDDGRFTITLTVEDDDGTRSDPHTIEIVVGNAPPDAAFLVARIDGRCVRFDASESIDPSPTGSILHVAWDFGDGTSCPGIAGGCGERSRWSPDHCYSSPGQYIVTLIVIDDQGALARTEKIILILE